MPGPSTVVVDDASAIIAFRNGVGAKGWRLDVVIDGSVRGHIDNGGGAYRYFEGPQNEIIWSFSESNLERLKARVRATVLAERKSD